MISNIHKYGNTTAASIPIALAEALESNKISKGDIIITSAIPGAGTHNFTMSSTNKGSAAFSTPVTVNATTTGSASGDAEIIASAITSAGVANVSATVDASNRVVISHSQGGEIKFVDTTGLLNAMGFKPFVSTDASTTANLAFVDGTTNATSPKLSCSDGSKNRSEKDNI